MREHGDERSPGIRASQAFPPAAGRQFPQGRNHQQQEEPLAEGRKPGQRDGQAQV